MEAFTFSTAELILLSAAGVFLIIQYIYYLGIYNRIHMRNITDRKNELHFTKELPPLSVVICARNESENLRRFLPAILEQDYPQFEVIVINDGSTDESEAVLSAFEEKYQHLYHSFTPDSARYISRKKLPASVVHGCRRFFCKEMGSFEKQTDLGQDRANRIGAFGYQLCNICFSYAVAR